MRRAVHRINLPRVSGSRHRLQRAGTAPDPRHLRGLLRTLPHASRAGKGAADSSLSGPKHGHVTLRHGDRNRARLALTEAAIVQGHRGPDTIDSLKSV